MTNEISLALTKALWKIYNRPARPEAWAQGGNLPWNDPAFSERMLREHLDQSHGAASRANPERSLQIDWLWKKLKLQPGHHFLDVTCGPGLYAVEFARRGCSVTGVDFSPASIAYARDLAKSEGVAARCRFIEQDVRHMVDYAAAFEAATLIYGQLGVFPQSEAQALVTHLAQALKPGGNLCVELLDYEKVDKTDSQWWFTDDKGLWGETPFLHLGERFWDAEAEMSLERFHTIDLQSGELTEVVLCDQSYRVETMTRMLIQAGFREVTVYPAWDGLSFYDADEWVVYIAEK